MKSIFKKKQYEIYVLQVSILFLHRNWHSQSAISGDEQTNKKALISLLLKDTFLISVPLSYWNLSFSGYCYSQLTFNIIILYIKCDILGKLFALKELKGHFKIILKIIHMLYIWLGIYLDESLTGKAMIFMQVKYFFRNFIWIFLVCSLVAFFWKIVSQFISGLVFFFFFSNTYLCRSY